MFAPLYLRKFIADATMVLKDITHAKVLWQCYSIMMIYTVLHCTSEYSSINMVPCSKMFGSLFVTFQ